jgi:hypothetical protein
MSLSGRVAIRHGQFCTSPPTAVIGTLPWMPARTEPASAGVMSALPPATACTAATEPSALTVSTVSPSSSK